MELKDFKIYIDPVHGAGDNGASGNGLVEHEINVKVANQLARILETWGADIFISIHCNGVSNKEVCGTETYTQRGNKASSYEKDLAQLIQDTIVDTLGTKDRGVKECDYNVFNNQTAFCVLTELATITNEGDANIIKRTDLKELSRNIAFAINSFVVSNFYKL